MLTMASTKELKKSQQIYGTLQNTAAPASSDGSGKFTGLTPASRKVNRRKLNT